MRFKIMAVSLAALLALSLGSCAGRSHARAPKAPDAARVEAHSAGLVPSGAAIKVVLTHSSGVAGAEAPAAVFRFDPPLAGKARWEDERTIGFSPAKGLVQGRNYRVEVDLGLIGGAAAGGPDYFSFDLRATQQRSIPTIVVSALGAPDDIDRAYDEFGVFAFVEKEAFDRTAFRKTVADAARPPIDKPGRGPWLYSASNCARICDAGKRAAASSIKTVRRLYAFINNFP